jgi:hypothetical protein
MAASATEQEIREILTGARAFWAKISVERTKAARGSGELSRGYIGITPVALGADS